MDVDGRELTKDEDWQEDELFDTHFFLMYSMLASTDNNDHNWIEITLQYSVNMYLS